MININKNSVNNVCLTLNESNSASTLVSGSSYVFNFYSLDTKDNKVFRSIDNSTNVGRYNQFNITENNTEDLENSTITLESGQYYYNVYNDIFLTGITEVVAISATTDASGNTIDIQITGITYHNITGLTYNDINNSISLENGIVNVHNTGITYEKYDSGQKNIIYYNA